MSMTEEALRNELYSDERKTPDLNDAAQELLDSYINELKDLSAKIRVTDPTTEIAPPWETWEFGLRQFYKKLIYDAFDNFRIGDPHQTIPRPEGMEVHFAGSLAKAQATEYSDLDAFVIVRRSEDAVTIKPIFDALNNLCQRIFTRSSQLYPDPIGINPSRLIGTVDELFSKLKRGEVANVEATTHSILNSKPILPGYILGEELRDRINQDPEFYSFCSAEKFYDIAINDFTAPQENTPTVSIKIHIMRPIDFILMGLREQYHLYQEDGSHLSAPGTIKLLRQEKIIPEEDINRIEAVYNKAIAKRFSLHAEAHKEEDTMPYAEAAEMLAEVALLRVLAERQIQILKSPQPEETREENTFASRYQNYFKATRMVMGALVIGAAVSAGLAFGGIYVLAGTMGMIATAGIIAGVTIGLAALSYGLFKAGQALVNWMTSSNTKELSPTLLHEPLAAALPNSASSVPHSYASMSSSLGSAQPTITEPHAPVEALQTKSGYQPSTMSTDETKNPTSAPTQPRR
jgi:hypothetical protein